jgi:diguanylate cyclase (GGDEF)-like protein
MVPVFKKYVISFVFVSLGLLIVHLIPALNHNSAHILLLSVILASLYGGIKAGVFALFYTVIGENYLTYKHFGNIFNTYYLTGVFFSFIVSFIISYLVTQEKKAKEEIQKLSLFDHLTGLPNRRMLEINLETTIKIAKRKRKKFALMFMDLDKFKQVNDTLGHDIGDLLLKEVAKRVRSSVRETDTVARLGGDEFVVLISDIKSNKDVETVAEKILDKLSRTYTLNGQKVKTSSSIGISLYPTDSSSSDELLKKADEALYFVKNNNKNDYKFYQSIS